jgi:hypothetical protein
MDSMNHLSVRQRGTLTGRVRQWLLPARDVPGSRPVESIASAQRAHFQTFNPDSAVKPTSPQREVEPWRSEGVRL